MIKCSLPRLFVVVLLCVAGPVEGQRLDRTHRRVIDATSRVNTRWGDWNGLHGQTTANIGPKQFHAEGQFPGVIAADFVFSADVTFDQETTAAHLEFRLSNEGRYGVAIGAGGVRVYRKLRRANLAIDDPTKDRNAKIALADQLSFEILQLAPMTLGEGVAHRVIIVASGPSLTVTVDGREPIVIQDTSLGVGRFGLYVFGVDAAASATFARVTADAMVLEASNFALLYNTLGYEAAGPKRALVRTLADLPSTWVKEALFEVAPLRGPPVSAGKLTYAKSLGMATWAADFGSLTAPGFYRLIVTMRGHDARLSGRGFEHRLVSAPFEIGPRLITRRMLEPLALLNPEARRAADHDLSWFWTEKSGRFIVQDDGVIYTEGDARYGAVLERTGDGYNGGAPLARAFMLSGDVAIDSGCDAQLQFQVTPEWRYAVTLQAGSAGGCVRGGPGAVSLHYEDPRPGSYRELARQVLPQPFERGRFYRIAVRVSERNDGRTYAEVDVDDVRMLTDIRIGDTPGSFAIKAWSANARFDHVIAWRAGSRYVTRNGVRIPVVTLPNGVMVTCEEGGARLTDNDRRHICDPLFAQRHGFFDCNNFIGEATSHGTFLAGLMDVWTRRDDVLDETERISLRRAIAGTAGYLDELQRTAGYTGEYAHEEPSRGARHGATGYYQVWLGLFGDAALAAKGGTVDRDGKLAHAACVRASRTVSWLLAEESRAAHGQPTRFPLGRNDKAMHDSLKSLVYAQLTQCAIREGDRFLPPLPVDVLKAEAIEAAHRWLNHLAENAAGEPRGILNAIPWLAGVDEVLRFGDDPYLMQRLQTLASKLRAFDPEGFLVVPPGTAQHWIDRTTVPASIEPLLPQPDTNPPLTWYIVSHFASSATDAAILFHYTGQEDSKNRAASSLGWILGLNPGIPSTKVINSGTPERPWSAAAFVSNLNVPSARGMEAYMTPDTIIKRWLYPWEEGVRSVHRESWFVQPKNNGFMTLMNGHMLWDGEWDYWNQGALGWMSGETFLLHDGAFLKAAITFEDALAGRWAGPHAALPARNAGDVAFFDTTLDQRGQTGWGFAKINDVTFAHASRMSQELCRRRGFASGQPTGHQIGELVGVLCVPIAGTRQLDVNQQTVETTGSRFTDINTVPWTEATRVAAALCIASPGGFFNGHQIGENRGIVCPGTNSAKRFSPVAINRTTWQDAAREATNFCHLQQQYAGGFFDGDQGVVCLRPGG